MTPLSRISSIAIPLLSLAACDQFDGADAGEELRQRQSLTVLTLNTPTSYYIDRTGAPEGYELRLTQALGQSLGLDIDYEIKTSIEDVLAGLRDGEGDLAAAGLTATTVRSEDFLLSPAYLDITEEVICRRRGRIPESVDELSTASLLVPAESSYTDTLSDLKQEYPDLTWEVLPDAGTEEALEAIWMRKADCTVADSNIVAVNRRYFPELEVAFALPADKELVWLMPQSGTALARYLADWIPAQRKDGTLEDLHERFYSYIPVFDYVDVQVLKRRITQRLPQYWPTFRDAAEKHDLPVAFLAAQSYQESHWNPRAKSPTGVRGIMMLTQATARRVGVTSRLDAEQNIYGGARYMRDLIDRLPEDIPVEDRKWFALAAYNLGMGHLLDARALAERRGLDKNKWRDLRAVLPELSHKDVYKTLKYGYARGTEGVRYVRRVRNYWDILRTEINATTALAAE